MPTYYVDPTGGNNTNAGDSFVAGHPWKSITGKSFSAGDIILVLKNTETGQAGTATATHGSVSVSTTSDLTGSLAQYDVIRFVGDNVLYMIKAITSTTITLYRPYRGTTGGGKTINKLTLPTAASGDWTPTAGNGTSGSHITLKGGMASDGVTQDGYTVISVGAGTNGLSISTKPFWDIYRMGFYNCTYPMGSGTFTDVTINDSYGFRGSGQTLYGFVRSTVNGFVGEKAKMGISGSISSIFNDLESADDANTGLAFATSVVFDSVFNRFRNAGYSGYYGITVGITGQAVFNDCVADELSAGITNVQCMLSTGWLDYVFNNLMVGSGTLLGTSTFVGWISFQNLNGVANDNRQYYGIGESSKYVGLLTRETTIYNTAAPSGKVALNQSAYPMPINFEIPCEAGVAKTVSVYFRKNSSYGSSTLPTMRLRWVTGSAGAYVWNQHDVAMSDTNDSFVQVSYTVTPAIQGVIKVDLLFQSAAASAIGYFDDLAWAA